MHRAARQRARAAADADAGAVACRRPSGLRACERALLCAAASAGHCAGTSC
jgi:hypothetical protein